jgi:catecholate siderophore receptor
VLEPLLIHRLLAGWARRTRQRVDQDNEILANQTNLSASFATGPLKHSLAAGLEFLYEKQNTLSFSTTGKTVSRRISYSPTSSRKSTLM